MWWVFVRPLFKVKGIVGCVTRYAASLAMQVRYTWFNIYGFKLLVSFVVMKWVSFEG